MYWTSLGVSDEDIIELYHNHAVCEQYHSEIKTDTDLQPNRRLRDRMSGGVRGRGLATLSYSI